METDAVKPIIEIESVSKSYREGDLDHVVLDGASATIAEGELIVVLGRSAHPSAYTSSRQLFSEPAARKQRPDGTAPSVSSASSQVSVRSGLAQVLPSLG